MEWIAVTTISALACSLVPSVRRLAQKFELAATLFIAIIGTFIGVYFSLWLTERSIEVDRRRAAVAFVDALVDDAQQRLLVVGQMTHAGAECDDATVDVMSMQAVWESDTPGELAGRALSQRFLQTLHNLRAVYRWSTEGQRGQATTTYRCVAMRSAYSSLNLGLIFAGWVERYRLRGKLTDDAADIITRCQVNFFQTGDDIRAQLGGTCEADTRRAWKVLGGEALQLDLDRRMKMLMVNLGLEQ